MLYFFENIILFANLNFICGKIVPLSVLLPNNCNVLFVVCVFERDHFEQYSHCATVKIHKHNKQPLKPAPTQMNQLGYVFVMLPTYCQKQKCVIHTYHIYTFCDVHFSFPVFTIKKISTLLLLCAKLKWKNVFKKTRTLKRQWYSLHNVTFTKQKQK